MRQLLIAAVTLLVTAVCGQNYPPIPIHAGDSVVIAPDTQDDTSFVLGAAPGTVGSRIWSDVVNWILANKTDYSVKAYLSIGDLTNDGTDAEYAIVKTYYDQMYAAGLPVIFVPGNHDMGMPLEDPGVPYAAFATSFLTDKSYFLGTMDAAYTNLAYQITVNSKPVLIVTMQHGGDNGVADRAWGQGIISAWVSGGTYSGITFDAHPTGIVWLLIHELWASDGVTGIYAYHHYVYELWLATSNLPVSLWISGHYQITTDAFAHHTLPKGTGYLHTLQTNYQQGMPRFFSPGTITLATFAASGWMAACSYKAAEWTPVGSPAIGWLGYDGNVGDVAKDCVSWRDPMLATGTFQRRLFIGK